MRIFIHHQNIISMKNLIQNTFLLFFVLVLTIPVKAQSLKEEEDTIYSPTGEPTHFQSFNLEEELKDKNNYAAGILKEFAEEFFLDQQPITWFKDAKAVSYFKYKGVKLNEKGQKVTFYVSWENFSDGLEWVFWYTCLTRSAGEDPYETLGNKKIGDNIKAYLTNQSMLSDKINPDVFQYVDVDFTTPQKTENIDFPKIKFEELYGVYVKKVLYIFDKRGNFKREIK